MTIEVKREEIQDILSNVQYRLPRFQRAYVWDKEQWDNLWEDLLNIHRDSSSRAGHFMGTMVVVSDIRSEGSTTIFKLVDGQQRLITISILLCVMRDLSQDQGLKQEIDKHLINARRSEEIRFKVLPINNASEDRETWQAIVTPAGRYKKNKTSPIYKSYVHFMELVSVFTNRNDDAIEKLFETLRGKLVFVYIRLDHEEHPHQIFESLNAKNVPLTVPDLVRNYIVMNLPEPDDVVKDAFDNYWLPIEGKLDEKKVVARNRGRITYFLYHYFTCQEGVLPNLNKLYAHYRGKMEQAKKEDPDNGFNHELEKQHRYADYYNKILRTEFETNTGIRERLNRLNKLDFTTGYPLLLHLYNIHSSGEIGVEEFLECLKLLENFMVRFFLAGESTNKLNRHFPTIISSVQRRNTFDSLKDSLLARYYQSDDRIQWGMRSRRLRGASNLRKCLFILTAINDRLDKGSGVRTVIEDSSIEHIMPQNIESPRDVHTAWRKELGSDWRDVHDEHLHTFGNLTMISRGWNSSLSNRPFSEKRQELIRHGLRINSEYFVDVHQWNKEAIEARTNWIVHQAFKEWPLKQKASSYTRTHFKGFYLFGYFYNVSNWYHMATIMTEKIASRTLSMDGLAQQIPHRLSKHKAQNGDVEISNGWFIHEIYDNDSVVDYCNELKEAAGLQDEDWSFKFE